MGRKLIGFFFFCGERRRVLIYNALRKKKREQKQSKPATYPQRGSTDMKTPFPLKKKEWLQE